MPSPYPQPLALAKLTGADKKNPQRYRDRKSAIQCGTDIGEPPTVLTPGALSVWLELQPVFVPGVLSAMDQAAFSVLCELVSQFREAPRDMPGAKLGKMISLFSLFGLTPVDRQRIRAQTETEEPLNPFEAFSVVPGGK